MEFDLIVIGSGPGGQRAALQAAKCGKKVALVEKISAVGGACTHTGTLPSKSLRESVYRWSLGSKGTIGKELEHVGQESPIGLPDMLRLMRRSYRVVSNESQIVYDQLSRNHIQLFQGHARFLDKNRIEIDSPRGKQRLSAHYFVIATGSHPVVPKGFNVDGRRIHDSDTILHLKKVPKSMIVVGAGVIGCEYASIFQMAGTHVHLIDKHSKFLAFVDREIVSHLVDRFRHYGMQIIPETTTDKVQATRDGVLVRLANGREIEAECCLVAMGRSGNSDDIGLDKVGIQPDNRGSIPVDASYRTKVKNIFAVGDIVGFPGLASTSFEQGRIAACSAFKVEGVTAHQMPEYYPYGIYTIPEISTVGKTEEEVQAAKIPYVVGRARYNEISRGLITGDQWGILKVIVETKTYKILGVHIVGDQATEIVHIGQAVMNCGGDVTYFIRNVFNYPTMAEAYKTAAFHAVNQILGRTSTR